MTEEGDRRPSLAGAPRPSTTRTGRYYKVDFYDKVNFEELFLRDFRAIYLGGTAEYNALDYKFNHRRPGDVGNPEFEINCMDLGR